MMTFVHQRGEDGSTVSRTATKRRLISRAVTSVCAISFCSTRRDYARVDWMVLKLPGYKIDVCKSRLGLSGNRSFLGENCDFFFSDQIG